jgi:hypothetical protein
VAVQPRRKDRMVSKNLRSDKPTEADIEMAVRTVEGIPNAMDMDLSGVDPEPTSLDICSEGSDSVADARCSNHQHVMDQCIICGQPLAEDCDSRHGSSSRSVPS